MIRAVWDDQSAEINGREYRFAKMVHTERRRVFAYYSSIQDQLERSNFAFLDTPEYIYCEKIMFKHVTFEGSLLAKLPDHFDEYANDYIKLITTAMGVMSYPFLADNDTSSQSQGEPLNKSTSKPVM